MSKTSHPPQIKAYLRHLATSGKSRQTIKNYQLGLGHFLGSFEGIEPEVITPEQLDEFFEDLRRHKSAATANIVKSAVRGFYGYLLETGKIDKNPARMLLNEKVVRKSPKVMNEGQREAFLAVISNSIGARPGPKAMRDFCLFALAYYTGLRVSELVGLNIEDVDNKKNLEVIGKGNKLDVIPLSGRMQVALKKYLPWRKGLRAKDPKALFVNRFGGRITTRAVQQNLKKWLKKAKIEVDFTPHSLRHTFGTNILRSTRNIRIAQKLLRHANVTTTQIYTHVDEGETRAAVEFLD